MFWKRLLNTWPCRAWSLEIQKLRTISEHTLSELYVFDQETWKFSFVNEVALRNLGFTSTEIIELTPLDLKHEFSKDTFHELLTPIATGKEKSVHFTTEHTRKDGSTYPVEVYLESARVANHRCFVASILDITERVERDNIIYNLAYFDQMTGLPNREHFVKQATVLLDRAKRRDWKTAFFTINVDDLKRINDTFGNKFGDEVLKRVAHYIDSYVKTRCLLEDDDCKCFCSRLGGDEFAVIVENVHSIDEADELTFDLFDMFNEPIDIDGREVSVTVSAGISMYPSDGDSVDRLMTASNLALRMAKSYGKNQHFFHNKSIRTKFEELMRYENLIRRMIDEETLDVHFQPIYSLTEDKVIGAEALLRTDDDVYGPLDLGEVITVAEETGLIVELGELVFRRACEECKRCDELGPKRIVSVNVSLRQVQDPEFVDMFDYIMQNVGVHPHNIALEVTESVMMESGVAVAEKLRKLQDKGVHVFIDDFGKGYSSMNHLRKLPANKLKIDKEFIDDLEFDSVSVEIVKGINNLAHSLDLLTCAEGVETETQKKILTQLGVDQIQGYLIGKPVAAGTFKCIHKGGKYE